MEDSQYDTHAERHLQCCALFDHRRYQECIQCGLRDMTDNTLPVYFQIKTLILLLKADNCNWDQAEVIDYTHKPSHMCSYNEGLGL